MKKNVQVWCAAGEWYETTWRESRKGGKRRFLKTRKLIKRSDDSLPSDSLN